MEKKRSTFLYLMLVVLVALLGGSCSDAHAEDDWVTGMEEGICDGAGNITWGMTYDEISALEGGVSDEDEIVFENITFAECSGQLRCSFGEGRLVSMIYILEGNETYRDYKRIREKFIASYGEAYASVTVEEVEESGTSWPKELWMQGVPTSGGENAYVYLESKFKEGWTVISLINSPNK